MLSTMAEPHPQPYIAQACSNCLALSWKPGFVSHQLPFMYNNELSKLDLKLSLIGVLWFLSLFHKSDKLSCFLSSNYQGL